MIFLYSSISSSKSVFGMVVISSPSFRSYCTCWTSASVLGCFGTGLPAAFLCTMFLLVLRLVSVLVLWFALPAVGFALLGSFHRCSRSSKFFSLSSYPCCFTSFFSLWLVACGSVSDSHHWLLGCGFRLSFLSHHWLFGCGPVCASFSVSLCGKLRLRGSFLASSQHHFSALRPS